MIRHQPISQCNSGLIISQDKQMIKTARKKPAKRNKMDSIQTKALDCL